MQFFLDDPTRRVFLHAGFLQQLTWIGQAIGLWSFWALCALMSPDSASNMGRRLMRFVGPRLKRSAKIGRNLEQAFPELSDPENRDLIRETWGNLGAVLAEYPHLAKILQQRNPPRIETVIPDDNWGVRNENQPVVFVAAHLGNWELAAAVAASLTGALSVVHSEQENPLILSAVQHKRRALGCGFVSKAMGLRPILRLLGQGTSIGMLVDVKLETGEPLPFFGRDALTTINPAQLALRFRCPLVPIQVERLGRARFRITVHESVTPEDSQADPHTQAAQMMRQVNTLFETWIRQRPGQWWCPGNRWPKPGKRLPRQRSRVA